jgi:L-lactate dehydrogenase complex protein LldG
MLARIRAARDAGATTRTTTPIPRDYRRVGPLAPGSAEAVELLTDRLVDYRAEVTVCLATDLGTAVGAALGPARSVVIPPELPGIVRRACAEDGRTVVVDGEPAVLTAAELDRIDAVVTGARVAIADTGVIILDGAPDQGRRAISLVPDLHVVVLDAGLVVQSVPEALARVDPTRPLTMIAGPSATSDIELSRVEGVHGPRTLRVIIAG